MRTAPPPVRAPREYGGGRLWKGRVGQFQTNEGGLIVFFWMAIKLCFSFRCRWASNSWSLKEVSQHRPVSSCLSFSS
jgi:hypothetical protein